MVCPRYIPSLLRIESMKIIWKSSWETQAWYKEELMAKKKKRYRISCEICLLGRIFKISLEELIWMIKMWFPLEMGGGEASLCDFQGFLQNARFSNLLKSDSLLLRLLFMTRLLLHNKVRFSWLEDNWGVIHSLISLKRKSRHRGDCHSQQKTWA